jgi:hypothetical protein
MPLLAGVTSGRRICSASSWGALSRAVVGSADGDESNVPLSADSCPDERHPYGALAGELFRWDFLWPNVINYSHSMLATQTVDIGGPLLVTSSLVTPYVLFVVITYCATRPICQWRPGGGNGSFYLRFLSSSFC